MDDNRLIFDDLVNEAMDNVFPGRGDIVDAILDTNAAKYRWHLSGVARVRPVLHLGVVDEIAKHQDIFSDDDVADFIGSLRPEVVVSSVGEEDRKLIEKAISKGKQKNKSRAVQGIGEVDVHTIAYALGRARAGEFSVAVSDDPDIYNAIDWLRANESFASRYVGCISPKNYLLEQHEDWLGRFNLKLRREFSVGIEGRYRFI